MIYTPPKNQRIFVGLFEIAGYYSNLRTGLEQKGCKVRMVTLSRHPFGYAEPPTGWIGWLIKVLVMRYGWRIVTGLFRGILRR